VVLPGSTEEVQEIIYLANRERIPVVPMVSGLNNAGLANPLQGGIVLDLRRMNRVLEVNEDDMYAVVEGGITWADLALYLNKKHPTLRPPITWSPPATGVVPSLLENGMHDLGMVGGCGSDFINGLEVVLPTGEIVVTGSLALSDSWYSRPPLPDISGLFIGWSGRTGIVTKASMKLWPKLPRRDYSLSAKTFKDGIEIEMALFKAGGPLLGICDITAINSFWSLASRTYSGLDLSRVPLEPRGADYMGMLTVMASTEKEMEAKAEVICDITKKLGGRITVYEEVQRVMAENERGITPLVLNCPVQEFPIWNFYMGGIGEWIGGYMPIRRVPEYYLESLEITKKYGKHALYYHRAMFGGHYNIARTLVLSNKDDPEDMRRTRECLMELDSALRKYGVRYKPQYWAVLRNNNKGHAGTLGLISRIKKMLDPNNILNPGQGM